MNKLANSKVVVAGGSSGIGLAAVELLNDRGPIVIVVGRDAEKLKKVKDTYPGVHTSIVDAADRKSLDAFFKETGNFDHLIITLSGGKGAGSFKELNLDHLGEGFAAKFFPQLHTMQAALPYLHQGSSITLVTAISARARIPGTSGLAAINGALEAMIPTLAKEFKPIRVNAVSPGVVDTAWWKFPDEETKWKTFVEYEKKIPAGRVAKAVDIAEILVFLTTSEFITGSVIESVEQHEREGAVNACSSAVSRLCI